MILFVYMIALYPAWRYIENSKSLFPPFSGRDHIKYASSPVRVFYLSFYWPLCCFPSSDSTGSLIPVVKELNIQTNRVTNQPVELTIVMASDLHLGNVIRKGRLVKWVNLINSLNPDIIILDGDIFDHSYIAVEKQNMDVELRRLHAKYGVFAAPGNHDYYTGS